jgi:hypothetical protein
MRLKIAQSVLLQWLSKMMHQNGRWQSAPDPDSNTFQNFIEIEIALMTEIWVQNHAKLVEVSFTRQELVNLRGESFHSQI